MEPDQTQRTRWKMWFELWWEWKVRHTMLETLPSNVAGVCNENEYNMHHIRSMPRIMQELDSLTWWNAPNYTWIIMYYYIRRVLCRCVSSVFISQMRNDLCELEFAFNGAVAIMHLVTDAYEKRWKGHEWKKEEKKNAAADGSANINTVIASSLLGDCIQISRC